MRILSVLAAAALAAALLLPALAVAETPRPQISVTGEGRVDGAPDMATISLGVTTQDKTAGAAMAANSDGVAAVLANLTAAGIAARDIQTTGLSLNPVWSSYDSGPVQKIEGYVAANMVTVRVRALDTLGTVLDAAVKDGANTLNGLTFGLADPVPAMDSARALAVADAQRKAAQLAQAAGVTLGPVLSISEGGAYEAPQPMFRQDAAASAVPVAGGEVATVATVTILYAIAP